MQIVHLNIIDNMFDSHMLNMDTHIIYKPYLTNWYWKRNGNIHQGIEPNTHLKLMLMKKNCPKSSINSNIVYSFIVLKNIKNIEPNMINNFSLLILIQVGIQLHIYYQVTPIHLHSVCNLLLILNIIYNLNHTLLPPTNIHISWWYYRKTWLI